VVAITVGADSLCVRDDGAGIAPEHLPKLFTRFWRGPGRRDSGAGLGLAICAEIALAHGWQLSARNATRGAEFVLSFAAPHGPLHQASAQPPIRTDTTAAPTPPRPSVTT
jgi:signal transduction histidine kinase